MRGALILAIQGWEVFIDLMDVDGSTMIEAHRLLVDLKVLLRQRFGQGWPARRELVIELAPAPTGKPPKTQKRARN